MSLIVKVKEGFSGRVESEYSLLLWGSSKVYLQLIPSLEDGYGSVFGQTGSDVHG